MGTITQRRVPLDNPRGYTTRNGQPYPTASDASVGYSGSGTFEPYQLTTSYRTGKLSTLYADDDEEAILNATNEAELYSALESEYKAGPQSSYDTGHPFSSEKRVLINTPVTSTKWVHSGNTYTYDGPWIIQGPAVPQGFYNQALPDLTWYGTKAIGLTLPTHPCTNLAVGLAELYREGFPKLGSATLELLKRGKLPGGIITSAGGITNVASEELLALEFGLKPVLRDLSSLASSIVKAKEIIDQTVRDSGKWIRRTYEFPTITSSEVLAESVATLNPLAGIVSAASNAAFNGGVRSGPMSHSVTASSRIWFSGAFTYTISPIGSLTDEIARIEELTNKLIGFRFTEEAMWNLTPWSWLVDWNVNIGQNIANASALASDGLVMAYGYIMCETRTTHHVSLRGPTLKSGSSNAWNSLYTNTVKKRIKASPFGFGLNPSGFSARQWSILAALGFTKSPGVLRGADV